MSRNLSKKSRRVADGRSVRERARDERELVHLEAELRYRRLLRDNQIVRTYCGVTWTTARLKARIAKLEDRVGAVRKRWPQTSAMRRRIAS